MLRGILSLFEICLLLKPNVKSSITLISISSIRTIHIAGGEVGLPELVLSILVILLFFRMHIPPFFYYTFLFLSNGYGFIKCIEIAMVT